MVVIEYFLIGLVILFFWSIALLIIHIIYMWIGIKSIDIKLPKSKKYEGKVDPIYEIAQGSYDDFYSVYKWELKYGLHEGLTWASLLIPFPITIYTYRYIQSNDSFKICELNEINTITPEYMIEFYEKRYEEEIKELEEWKEKRRNKETHLDYLNKTFNENYE